MTFVHLRKGKLLSSYVDSLVIRYGEADPKKAKYFYYEPDGNGTTYDGKYDGPELVENV